MTALAASHHDGPTPGPDGLVATPHASRRDAAQMLTLLLGTVGILLALVLLLGSPLGGVR